MNERPRHTPGHGLRVAIAQLRPVWLNRAATTERVLSTIAEAAAAGAELLVFPETFLPGYPAWVCRTDGARFDDPGQKDAYAYYLEQAVETRGPELRVVAECAADHGLFVWLGVAERSHGTIYCSLLAINPADNAASVHRKLVPTYDERLVWGQGDGHGLRTHRLGGARVGGLCCWENWMPLARHALYADGEDVHLGVWPGSTERSADLTQFVAREGRVWSLAAAGILNTDDVPQDFPLREQLLRDGHRLLFDGGSAIAAPDGSWLVPPVVGVEQLIVADLDLRAVGRERLSFDPAGHYSRPDVFSSRVDRRRRAAIDVIDEVLP